MHLPLHPLRLPFQPPRHEIIANYGPEFWRVASTVLLEAHAQAAAAGSPPSVPTSKATTAIKATKATKAATATTATKPAKGKAAKAAKAGSRTGAPAPPPTRAAGDELEATRGDARGRKKPRTRK